MTPMSRRRKEIIVSLAMAVTVDMARYYVFVLDHDTVGCFLDDQDMPISAKKYAMPTSTSLNDGTTSPISIIKVGEIKRGLTNDSKIEGHSSS